MTEKTEHMKNMSELMYQKLWDATKILSIFEPFTYGSEYYSHRDAAEQLSKALPEQERAEFMTFVNKKIENFSRYSGD